MRAQLVLVGSLLALSACATSVTDRGLAAQAKRDKILNSCAQDADSRGISALTARTEFFSSDLMTLEMLTSTQFPTEDEKTAIAKLWDSVKQCGEQFTAFLKSDLNEDIATLWMMDVNRQLLQLADLYNGSVSWGAFNRDLKRLDTEFRFVYAQATRTYWQGEYAQAERRQAAIGAALQAYGNALKNYGNTYNSSLRNQPAVQQAPIYDPVRTSCRENGNRITCSQSSALMTSPRLISCRVNGSVMTCSEQ